MSRLRSIAAFVAVLATTTVGAQVMDRPAATVKLTKPEFISVTQLQQQMAQFDELRKRGIQGIPTDPKVILDSMIQEVLIRQGAENSKIVISDSQVDVEIAGIKQRLEQQQGGTISDQVFRDLVFRETGLGWDEYRKSLREQLLTRAYIQREKKALFDAITAPTDREIEEQYRLNATSFTNPEIIRYSEVFVDTRNLSAADKQKARERAETAYRAIVNGAGSFADIVLRYTDDTQSRYNGGDRGFVARNDARFPALYGQEFVNSVFALTPNQVSRVTESRAGYHIVKITDHREPKILKLGDPINPAETTTVRDFIRALLLQEKQTQVFQQALKELVADLKAKAEIRIFEENIKL